MWAKAGVQFRDVRVWTDEELRAFIKSGTKPLGIVPGKTQH